MANFIFSPNNVKTILDAIDYFYMLQPALDELIDFSENIENSAGNEVVTTKKYQDVIPLCVVQCFNILVPRKREVNMSIIRKKKAGLKGAASITISTLEMYFAQRSYPP